MDTVDLTDSQFHDLSECVTNGRMGQAIEGIIYASATLFLYDYCLTVLSEVKYVWCPGRVSISSSAFMVARYGTMADIVLALLPSSRSPAVDNGAGVLRFLAIIASQLIVAVRTWAIWNKNRMILIVLTILSLATMIPATVLVIERIISNRVVLSVTPEFQNICILTIGKISQAFVAPFILVIFYEFVNLTFSLIRIVKWRKTIPKNIRAPIIDTLWRDGVMYFSFMLVLGSMNIGIVLQQVPQFRAGGIQLQAVFQSILSTRIVLHLAGSRDSRDITAPGCSVYQSNSGNQFTSLFTTVDRNDTHMD
ncbi:hypothetical protein BDP27DRAFT_737957 [Rhodocollybia butyracea]|uniref:DUF6533 domain-containing protein n=1 Tax=Rhodocollybia butyracea TaxID=206335 RepID=A0A9P5U7P7_9AGAR|nr:hypothetical protein BDP27DRAFT_737957 [Rhodocollybia butyracea]